MLFDSQPSLKSQESSAPVRAAVEARDREPCVEGVSGASAGKKSAPPFLLSSWLRFRKVFFSASVRAAQLGREGRAEGGREGGQAGKQAVGEARE